MSRLYFIKALEKILYFSFIYQTSFLKSSSEFCFFLPSTFSVLVSEPLCLVSVVMSATTFQHKAMALNISPVKWSALQA